MSYSESEEYSTEDDIGTELTPEHDLSINLTLDKTVNSHQNTSIREELKTILESKKNEEEILNENEKILENISKDEDEVDKYLRDYFGKRRFSKLSKITKQDYSSDDIDDLDEALEFEENFNNRFDAALQDSDDVQTHPRRLNSKEMESARRRKRRIRREQEQKVDNETQSQFEAIDEKYKQIALANNGHLTNEQLSAWADEVAQIEIGLQGGTFQYHEVKPEGDAIAILDESSNTDSEDDELPNFDEENNNEENNEQNNEQNTEENNEQNNKIKENSNSRGYQNRDHSNSRGYQNRDHSNFRGYQNRDHNNSRGYQNRDHGSFKGHPKRGNGYDQRGRRSEDPYTAHRH